MPRREITMSEEIHSLALARANALGEQSLSAYIRKLIAEDAAANKPSPEVTALAAPAPKIPNPESQRDGKGLAAMLLAQGKRALAERDSSPDRALSTPIPLKRKRVAHSKA